MTEVILTAERVRELLAYDPDAGIFTRRVRTSNRIKAGDVTGVTNQKGYLQISIDGRRYLAHRLAWMYMFGSAPACQLDHINGQRVDNRLCNLREVTNAQNQQNMRIARANNKSGFLGVCWHAKAKTWRAQIGHCGKIIHLGCFDTAQLAHAAYVQAKRHLHPMGML